MAHMVLDRLRKVVLDGRRAEESQPKPARDRVYVTPSGRVVIGDPLEAREERDLSEVHPAVFASPRG